MSQDEPGQASPVEESEGAQRPASLTVRVADLELTCHALAQIVLEELSFDPTRPFTVRVQATLRKFEKTVAKRRQLELPYTGSCR